LTPPNLNHQGTAAASSGHQGRHTIGDLQTQTREKLHGLRSPSPHSLVRCVPAL
jgi:hypothetical protein